MEFGARAMQTANKTFLFYLSLKINRAKKCHPDMNERVFVTKL